MTDRYAVMGNPIAHSKSPVLHVAFARQSGQDMDYGAINAPQEGFPEAVRRFQNEGGKGLNITVPFKLQAFSLADALTERAKSAGAVNTFSFRADGSIWGDTTDGVGLTRDITHNLEYPIQGRRVLLLGAGGAVRGVLSSLWAEHPAEIFIANRTASRAVQLAQEFRALGEAASGTRDALISGGGFEEAEGGFDLIIHGTSSGIADEVPPVPKACWRGVSLAYDMFYGDEPTPFLRAARAAGVQRTSDGLGMLVEQGAESFFLWRLIRPDTAPVIALLREMAEKNARSRSRSKIRG